MIKLEIERMNGEGQNKHHSTWKLVDEWHGTFQVRTRWIRCLIEFIWSNDRCVRVCGTSEASKDAADMAIGLSEFWKKENELRWDFFCTYIDIDQWCTVINNMKN